MDWGAAVVRGALHWGHRAWIRVGGSNHLAPGTRQPVVLVGNSSQLFGFGRLDLSN